jgi:hypothetical protein
MSDRDKSRQGSGASAGEDGVLANLPPTRPQRTSRRRTEARKATARATRTAARGAPSRGAQDRGPEDRSRERRVGPRLEPTSGKRAEESAERRGSVPKQGFESESDLASGPVQPPGAVELVGSAVEIVTVLARGGLSAGERLLGDLVSRLPKP